MATRRQSKAAAKTKRPHRARRPRTSQRKTTRNHPRVRRGMKISEILALHPKAGEVLDAYGLSCHHCVLGAFETLEEGASFHGLISEDINNLFRDLQKLPAKPSPRSARITVTKAAAQALTRIAVQEKKTGQVLRVMVDEGGKYCLEFRAKPMKGDRIFCHPDVPNVRIAAASATLERTGCVTISVHGGTFKLEPSRPGSCGESACSCGEGAKPASENLW